MFMKLRDDSQVETYIVFGVSSPLKFPMPIYYRFKLSFCSKLSPAMFGRDMFDCYAESYKFIYGAFVCWFAVNCMNY